MSAVDAPRRTLGHWVGKWVVRLLLLRNTDDSPKVSLRVGNQLRRNRRCHPMVGVKTHPTFFGTANK